MDSKSYLSLKGEQFPFMETIHYMWRTVQYLTSTSKFAFFLTYPPLPH